MTGHGRRAVRGAAVAAAAMAVLTASQAQGALASAPAPVGEGGTPGPSVSGDSAYRTELPPLRARGAGGPAGGDAGEGSPVAGGGALPAGVFAAYRRAESELGRSAPGCGLRWQLLAAIGQVESGQAHGGRVGPDGTTVTPILGPRLDGNGFARITDTDGGAYDGDTVYDRAVGPMQFIPSTWAVWGTDGNGDGRADPSNIHDAALSAGRYLCAGGRDLSEPADLDRAILGYNRSTAYLRTVLAWFDYFLQGHLVVPDAGGAGTAAPRATPAPSRTARPAPPGPDASTRPRGTGGADGTRPPGSSASPAPRPTEQGTEGPGRPVLPVAPVPAVPTPRAPLPGGGVPSGTEPLVGNGKDSMRATPSTTPDTRR
ncbi:lytic murein transglycosylase [Streptomyces tirandamycinicus]|uniref:lytic transglycosylase domain-containing protein n=1 Tax=Streptomyces tirandamycinicus TaxID=2174846 RepID=UPI00342D090F